MRYYRNSLLLLVILANVNVDWNGIKERVSSILTLLFEHILFYLYFRIARFSVTVDMSNGDSYIVELDSNC